MSTEPLATSDSKGVRNTLLPWLTETLTGEESCELPLTGPCSAHEEFANSLTHGLGFFIAVAASFVLMTAAISRGSLWTISGCAVYSTTLMLVYLASTLSHVYRQPVLKRTWRIFDQAFIYLLVAGSYTPWGLVYLSEGWEVAVLVAMWVIALAGFTSKVFFGHRVYGVALWIYLLLGWLPIMAIVPILKNVPHAGLWWMLAGGLCYSFGVLFLKYDDRVPFFHAVWHKLVIAGSVCHWLAVWWYVVGM